MDTARVLEMTDVSVRRGNRTVLEQVSLRADAGRIHVVVGPNGAGKSTLISAILGETPFEGSIELCFRGTGRIGYVPQSFAADRTLPITVAEFLALPRQRWPVCMGITAAARTRVAALLERVNLAGMERRRMGELSGGELRRVLIANALDPAPELLLCDEPAAGLDPEAVERLDRLLCSLRDDDQTAIVVVSHDPAQVRRIADHVTLLDLSVRRSGSADQVLGPPGAAGSVFAFPPAPEASR